MAITYDVPHAAIEVESIGVEFSLHCPPLSQGTVREEDRAAPDRSVPENREALRGFGLRRKLPLLTDRRRSHPAAVSEIGAQLEKGRPRLFGKGHHLAGRQAVYQQ